MATQVDILVGVHRIVVAERTEYVVCVQTFARKLDFAPRYVPLKASNRRQLANRLLPMIFACGVLLCAWVVLSQ